MVVLQVSIRLKSIVLDCTLKQETDLIPRLAFNDRIASCNKDINKMGELFSILMPKLHGLSSPEKGSRFLSKMSSVEINELKLTAISNSPLIVERSDIVGCDFFIPILGSNKVSTCRGELTLSPRGSAFLGICERRTWADQGRSAVHTVVNFDILLSVYRSMSGFQTAHVDFKKTRTPHLRVKGVSFFDLFMALFKKIDAAAGDSRILARTALDDSFHRLCVGLFKPEIFQIDSTLHGKRPDCRDEITKICEWLRENLNNPISLTAMESKCGLSTRVMQYSFRKAFGIRPKEWLRQQRLYAARDLLLEANQHRKITEIAYDFNFASASEFTRYYRQEFGELPSETRRNKKR